MEQRTWLDVNDDRFWKLLLAVGLVLHALVAFNSELGLDSHIHAAYVTLDSAGEDGLDWGHTRPLDPQASDPSYSPENGDRYAVWHLWYTTLFALMGPSVGALKAGALVLSALSLLAIGLMSRDLFGDSTALRIVALVSIHPTFLFASGRAYPEELMLVAMCAFVYGLMQMHRMNAAKGLIPLLLGAWVGVSVKGLDMSILVCALGGALLVLMLRDIITDVRKSFILGCSLAISAGVIGMLLADGGTLGVASEAPARYISAVAIAVFDVVIVYSLFGMTLWPFINSRLAEGEQDGEASVIAMLIGFSTVGIILYVAALWTLESLLWDADWPWVTWTLGNNARYASMLMVPAFWLLSRLHASAGTDNLTEIGDRSKVVLIGILLILPISLLTALHGQTTWTDEAANTLDSRITNGDEFLLVSDSELGMHWLYTFHLQIDADGSRGVTGHWRSADSNWLEEMAQNLDINNRGDISDVEWIVLAPEVEVPETLDCSISGEAPWMNGGGTWRICSGP